MAAWGLLRSHDLGDNQWEIGKIWKTQIVFQGFIEKYFINLGKGL